MKALSIVILKLAGLALALLCWRLVSRHAFSFLWSVVLMWGTVALVPVVAIVGHWLLDRHPTPQRAALLTIPIHYLEGILLGCALIVAFRFTQAYPMTRVAVPSAITSPLLKILGIFATLTVLNLAIRGLGLPFAAVLSKRLASDWLYARSRNPMLLSALLFFIVGAVCAPVAPRDPVGSPVALARVGALRQVIRRARTGSAVRGGLFAVQGADAVLFVIS